MEVIFDEFVTVVSQSPFTHSVFSQGPGPEQVIEVLLSSARTSPGPMAVNAKDAVSSKHSVIVPPLAVLSLFDTMLYTLYRSYLIIFGLTNFFTIISYQN